MHSFTPTMEDEEYLKHLLAKDVLSQGQLGVLAVDVVLGDVPRAFYVNIMRTTQCDKTRQNTIALLNRIDAAKLTL